MTIRTLFVIILKILGIFFIRDFLSLIPQLISFSYAYRHDNNSAETMWGALVTAVLVVLLYGFIAYALIFKTNSIIDALRLDNGFAREDLPLNMHRSTILGIAILVIGGYMFIDEIPNCCRLWYEYFQIKTIPGGQANPKISYLLVSVLRIIIGFLLVVEQRWIINFIERKKAQSKHSKTVDMTIIEKLASALGHRDESPNIDLARQLVAGKDSIAIKELVANLANKNKNIQNDCIKVLYEIGELKPELIKDYAKDFVALLDSKNNRLQWGAMTAIQSITAENADIVYKALPKIMAAAEKGSAITRDNAIAILVRLCAVE